MTFQKHAHQARPSGPCAHCGNALHAIGHARKNGKPHPDWNSRKWHKKCWVALGCPRSSAAWKSVDDPKMYSVGHKCSKCHNRLPNWWCECKGVGALCTNCDCDLYTNHYDKWLIANAHKHYPKANQSSETKALAAEPVTFAQVPTVLAVGPALLPLAVVPPVHT